MSAPMRKPVPDSSAREKLMGNTPSAHSIDPGYNSDHIEPVNNRAETGGSKFTMTSSTHDLHAPENGYFTGPIDSTKHSKLPYFMRIKGSVTPGLILPITFVLIWSTVICVISKKVHSLAISPQLITILGFLVGLSLSFRSSTAYERYNEGRKYWSALALNSRSLARIIWINGIEREGEEGEEDLLAKLTAINLIQAFAVAMKYRLRYEPEYDLPDLSERISHLDTFAKDVHHKHIVPERKEKTKLKRFAAYLGITFFESDPAKRIAIFQRHGQQHGHLPLEILNYLQAYLGQIIKNETLKTPAFQAAAMTNLTAMTDCLTGCERILATPLPIAYNIVISQVTWLYVLTLPFQLYSSLKWITIPATVIAAYMIIGLAAIGREIENPFGDDVNDLDLDSYCKAIDLELDIITSRPAPKRDEFIFRDDNYVMYPNVREGGYESWKARGIPRIQKELLRKPVNHLKTMTVDAREQNQELMKERDEKKAQEVQEFEVNRNASMRQMRRRTMMEQQQDAGDAA